MSKENDYAQAVISLQISVPYKGKDCYVLVKDPEKITEGAEGYTWPGGMYFPSCDLFESALKTQMMEVGARLIPQTMELTHLIYSRTKSGRWVGNRAIRFEAEPIDSWSKPEDGDFEVALFDAESIRKGKPKKVETIYGGVSSGSPRA